MAAVLALTGERQVGTSLSQIRENHIQRYLWAAAHIPPHMRVLDCACGVGYGSSILARNADQVVGVDCSSAAIEFANEFWAAPNIEYVVADAESLPSLGVFDVVVSFETLEHLDNPGRMLDAVEAPLLIGSVPNEQRIPFHPDDFPFHKRHYRPDEIEALCGKFKLRSPIYGQLSNQVHGFSVECRTLVFMADAGARWP